MSDDYKPRHAAPEPTAPKPDSIERELRDLIARFSETLLTKLIRSEEKYGWQGGWSESGWMDKCRDDLRRHVEKGDPLDVAAYCAFLWHHGASSAEPAPIDALDDVCDECENGMQLVDELQNGEAVQFERPCEKCCGTGGSATVALAWAKDRIDVLAQELAEVKVRAVLCVYGCGWTSGEHRDNVAAAAVVVVMEYEARLNNAAQEYFDEQEATK